MERRFDAFEGSLGLLDEIVGDDLVIVAEAALPGQEDQVPGTHTLGVAELGGVLQLRNRDDFLDGHVFPLSVLEATRSPPARAPGGRVRGEQGNAGPPELVTTCASRPPPLPARSAGRSGSRTARRACLLCSRLACSSAA